jgi:hypothetical protein
MNGGRVRIVSEAVSDGVVEQGFELDVADERIAGVLWSPADAIEAASWERFFARHLNPAAGRS